MTDTASDSASQMSGEAVPACPTTHDRDAWKAYWQALAH